MNELTEEQKQAMIRIINLLMAVIQKLDLNDQAKADLFDAADLLGISKLDLLRGTME